ncbi:hypothetical protein [Occallatibacter savannae]|uniref:hypothetical protein n=1 Tax=Occallatibacter savannae TaxID=1002691 RepID=UPI000D68E75E|nr:hypothetical protein [Occallatibacter savannae]
MRIATRLFLAAPVAALAMLVSAHIASAQNTETVEAGHTIVTFSSDFISALGALDVAPGTVTPTRWHDGVVSFPINSGALDLDTAAGQLLHSGGLTLSSNADQTKVTLQSFILTTTGTPVITALVSVNERLIGRMPLFRLTLPAGLTLPLAPSSGRIILNGVGLSLESGAATTLNSVFHVSAFQGGLPIGTAKVVIHLADDSDTDHE